MKNFFYKPILMAIVAAGFLSSCINDDDYDVPQLSCEETSYVKTIEPQDVPATAVATQYLGNDFIEAYVVSSDIGGNFFKSISLQTLDGSFGFSVPVDVTTTFTKFEPGRKVIVKLDSTYVDVKFGSMRIGASFNNEVGRLSVADYNKVLNRTCTIVSEDSLVQHVTITQALNNQRINTLIELDNVHFEESAQGNTYYDAGNAIGGATNYNLVDEQGNTIIFRSSSFAAYAGKVVPNGTGKVRGVLTKFNNDFQFVAREESDIKIENIPGTDPGTDPNNPGNPNNPSTTAKGGTEIAYLASFTENFESYAVGVSTFPEYINDLTLGDRYWQTKTFSNNKYIEMSSFNGANIAGKPAKSYFMVPVNFDTANTMSFDKEIRYMNGEALKVYYVTSANYTPLNTINVGSFVDITSFFSNLTYPASGQSQNNFTTAGTYAIPASVTGNGFFVFEYTGSTTVTTTIQLDNIVIN